jgi:histidyl-tRNA synthetase
VSEGTRRERDERTVKDQRRGAKGEGMADAKSVPLGVGGVRQSGVEPPRKPDRDAQGAPHSKKAAEARRKFRSIEGTRDILPPDSALWNWFEKTARDVMEGYNFAEIRTPIFEETELFARSIGADTDVVAKEMYSFEDRERVSLPQIDELSDIKAFFKMYPALKKSLLERAQQQQPLPEVQPLFDFLDEYVDAVGRRLEKAKEAFTFLTEAWQTGLLPKTSRNEKSLVKLGEMAPEFRERTSTAAALELLEKIIELLNNLDFGVPLSLRPEATASVCRAYIEHGMQTRPGDQKLYYVGPMFRRERPQKGRYRQFYQIGAEVLGTSDAPAIDAELIEMLTVLIGRCKIEKWTLLINSIGCADSPGRAGCRPAYIEKLRAELRKPEIFSKLGPDSQRRVETNPLRVMDSKLPEEQAIIEALPKITEHLCGDCQLHYAKLKTELGLRSVPFTESPRLVRGLDYYMRTTFEITSPVLGAQNALCGGGRYDGLVEMLGGPKGIKGIGFALGEDRFIDAIVEAKRIDATRAVDVFVAWMGEQAYPEAVRLARVLRDAGRVVELPPEEMKFRKAFERADKIGARYVLILGEDEIASKRLTVKILASGDQKQMGEAELLNYIRH